MTSIRSSVLTSGASRIHKDTKNTKKIRGREGRRFMFCNDGSTLVWRVLSTASVVDEQRVLICSANRRVIRAVERKT